jgi:hypothetical protein
MTKIDINALPPVREPDDKGIAGGFESLAGRARASTSSADIDHGDAATGLASRATEFDGAAGDTAFSINREAHHATMHGAPPDADSSCKSWHHLSLGAYFCKRDGFRAFV